MIKAYVISNSRISSVSERKERKTCSEYFKAYGGKNEKARRGLDRKKLGYGLKSKQLRLSN